MAPLGLDVVIETNEMAQLRAVLNKTVLRYSPELLMWKHELKEMCLGGSCASKGRQAAHSFGEMQLSTSLLLSTLSDGYGSVLCWHLYICLHHEQRHCQNKE